MVRRNLYIFLKSDFNIILIPSCAVHLFRAEGLVRLLVSETPYICTQHALLSYVAATGSTELPC